MTWGQIFHQIRMSNPLLFHSGLFRAILKISVLQSLTLIVSLLRLHWSCLLGFLLFFLESEFSRWSLQFQKQKISDPSALLFLSLESRWNNWHLSYVQFQNKLDLLMLSRLKMSLLFLQWIVLILSLL